jgi:hypothetical protein
MTWLHLSLLATLLLTGCGPAGSEATPAAEQEASPTPAGATQAKSPAFNPAATPAAESLAGEYRVAGIDGVELDAPIGIAVSIGPRSIELAPCAGFAWTYTHANGVLETERIPVSPDEPICRIPEETARAGVAMAAASRVRRTSANGLEFSGGGRSVLLFSQ